MRWIGTIGLLLWMLVATAAVWADIDQPEVLVVLGLPDKLMPEASRFAEEQFVGPFDTTISSVTELDAEGINSVTGRDAADFHILVAAGVNGCRYAFETATQQPVFCLLLSQRSFETLQVQYPDVSATALVVDQPVNRQIAVANSLFPALRNFSVPDGSDIDSDSLPPSIRSEQFRVSKGSALAVSIADAVADTDALVAVPDAQVFNRNTLRTVMLTAYGYGKPVIGYSKAYVRAGALMSTYSDIRQCFRNAADLLNEYLAGEDILDQIHMPRYFSIEVNSSIARSLKLVRRQRDLSLDWMDKDFAL